MSEADPNANPAGDDDSEEEGTPWTPPTKEEWEKTQRTAAARKRERDEARREAASFKEAAAGKTTAPPPEDKTAKTEARVKRQAGITALVTEGLSRDQAKELVGMLRLGELDEDGDVEGLDDSVADLKAKFPTLFTVPGKKTPAKVTTTDGGTKTSTKTPTDRTSEKLMRAAGLLA